MAKNLEKAIAALHAVHDGKMAASRKGGTSPTLQKAIDALDRVRAGKNAAARKTPSR